MNALRLTVVAALSALAIVAQTAYADQTLTRAQVRAELAQAKANGQISFGELDYPAAGPAGVASSRTQVVAELAQARAADLISSGDLDYPPAVIASDATVTRAQVQAELARAQAAGMVSFGEGDYPVVGS